MKAIITFVAYKRSRLKYPSGRAGSTSVELSDSAFDKLSQIVKNKDDRSIEVSLDEASESYHCAVNLIFNDIGKLPNEYVGVGVRQVKEFSAGRTFIYTAEELDCARALLVLPKPNLADFAGLKGGMPMFKTSSLSGERFGALFPSWRLGVTEALGERMKECGFTGLRLVEIVSVEKGAQEPSIYWINPTITLPRSKLNLCDNLGQSLSDRSKGCHFISKSDSVELVYDQAEFNGIEFDVAYTQEKIGADESVATQLIVVSQTFRRFLELQVDSELEFAPVHFESLHLTHT